ncbi:MAG: PorT family protein [Saprospiraceae bacterium]|nr:PorT family protein [Saprospiraceae bacterium]
MKNNFDHKLTDLGWKSMRRLLDREMPEQPRRRRFAWWIFALLLLPLSGVGGWWWWSQPTQTETTNPPKTNESNPTVTEPVVKAAPSIRAKDSHVAARNDAEESRRESKRDVPLSRISRVPALGDRLIVEYNNQGRDWLANKESSNAANSSERLPLNIHAEATPESRGTSDAEAPMETPMSEPTSIISDNTIISPDEAPHTIADIAQPETTSLSPTSTTTTLAPPPLTNKAAQPSRWSLGLTTSAATNKFTALNGFAAGAALNWQFAQKWGLRSGLQYAYYRIAESERPVISLTAGDYARATGDFSVILDNTPVSNSNLDPKALSVYVSVERLHRLEAPLLAYWQPIRPLRVMAGLLFSYTLNAQTSDESIANNKVYVASSSSAKSRLNGIASKNLKHLQAQWQSGIGLCLGKHLELGLSYRFSISGNATYEAAFQDNQLGHSDLSEKLKNNNRIPSSFLLSGIWFF